MVKQRKQRKTKYSNNKGFSLVEVLVAMALLSVVSFGIIEAFSNAAKVNGRARREENANTLATDIAEQFRALTVDELKNKYNVVLSDADFNEQGKATKDGYKYDETTGDYIFYLADVTGNDGENFSLRAELDAATYTKLNDYSIPQYSNIQSEDTVVIRQELDKYNSLAAERYVREVPTASVSDAKKNVSKKTVLYVTVENNTDTDSVIHPYSQKVKAVVSYYCDKNGSDFELLSNTVYEQLLKIDTLVDVKPVYLFYTPYGIGTDSSETKILSGDKIDINYDYKNLGLTDEQAKAAEYNFNVFLAEQSVMVDSGKKLKLQSNNVSAYINTCKKPFSMAVTEGTLKLGAASNINPVNIYSNIEDWDKYGTGSGTTAAKNSLSDGQSVQPDSYLYSMNIKVFYRDEAEPIVELKTTKNN